MIGRLSGCKIDEVCDGGLYYGVSYDNGYRYETWFNIRRAGVEKESQLTKNDDIKISYSNVTIESLLHRYYFFASTAIRVINADLCGRMMTVNCFLRQFLWVVKSVDLF